MTPQDLIAKIASIPFNGQTAITARNAFIEKFPLSSIPTMTPTQYRQNGNKDSFCYNLEYVNDLPFGIGGGNNDKFGKASNPGFPNVQGIADMIADASSGNVSGLQQKHHLKDVSVIVLIKILAIYLPDKFLTIAQSFTLELLASILGVGLPQPDLIELNYRCMEELVKLNPDFITQYQFNRLGSAIWQILSPANRPGFAKWLKSNRATGSGSISAYLACMDRLCLFYKENYFSTNIQLPVINDLYEKAISNQKRNGGEYYGPGQSYGNNNYYSATARSYGVFITTVGSGATAGVSSTLSASSTTPPIPLPKREYPKNLILYGPPGTGKTFNTIRYAVSIIEGLDVEIFAKSDSYQDRSGKLVDVKDAFDDFVKAERISFTTFHQSLSYEDFIEGIKPEPTKKKDNVLYDVKPGILKLICERATKAPEENFVLVIDEINRGNVASIFGELITLIEEDKRAGMPNCIQCTLPYSKEPFSVPSNLYIIGTMNTADRSVEALDSALRRRFDFFEMMPDPDKVTYRKDVFEVINSRLRILKDAEHQLGHSYFIGVTTAENLCDVFHNKVIPLIQEYFYGDMEKIRLVIGDGFCVKEMVPTTLFPNNTTDIDIPTETWRLWDEKKWQECKADITVFTAAIDRLMNG